MSAVERSQLVSIAQIIENAGGLFTLPDICLQLQTLIDDPSSNADKIAHLLASDPALTARILKLANSALYGFPSEITSVSQAITLIGTNEVSNLAIATSAAQIFLTAGGGMLDMAEFWHKSILVGLISQQLGQYSQPKQKEGLFVSGLLFDLGKLLVLEQAPFLASSAIQQSAVYQPYWEREQEVMGYTFADVGAALLESWNLPALIVNPVKLQHSVAELSDAPQQASTLYISVRLASDICKKQDDQVDYADSVDEQVMQFTGIGVDDLEQAVEEAQPKVRELTQLFL